MIYLLHGENEFEKRQRLAELTREIGGELERIDGEELTSGQLRELLAGQTLFADERLVVISGLSESPAWAELPELAENVANQVILLENKLDKRTKTYKFLKKQAKTEEFTPWGDRDRGLAISWCTKRAKDEHKFDLKRNLAETLVDRLGLDQMRLDNTLEQLSLAEKVDEKLIDLVVPLAKSESVFGLMEAVLSGRRQEVRDIINYLEATSGPDGAYMTIGLLTSQLIILNALVLGGQSQEVAKDFGAHPFVVSKLTPYARKLDIETLRKMNQSLQKADLSMKTTSVSPWLLLETALVEMI